MNGRKRIYTDENLITIDNVRKVVLDAFPTHEANSYEIKKLMDIEKNIQTLSREKTIREEINIVATDPIASQIVDFKQGYEHGTPINYTQRANVDSDNPEYTVEKKKADDLRIATLNEMMRECKKASKDNKMSRDIKICGVGYRYIAPKKRMTGISPFEIYILNPLRTFVIYSNDVVSKPMAAVTFTENLTNHYRKYGVWTEDSYYEFEMFGNESKKPIKQEVNYIGYIPIVEYINNYDYMGSFEKELPLIDAYNIVTSDRVNDICQQVQSILWLHNTRLDNEQQDELVNGGVIQTQANADGKDAKIQYVNAPLRQSDVQTLSTDLKDRILESAGVPKLSESSNSTGEAMRVTNGWHTAETQAKVSELTWRESEDECLEVCLAIIRNANVTINGVDKLKLSDIDYDMHRSENYDISSRVNSFATLVNMGGDIAKAAAYCKITDDPLQFAMDSENNIDKLRFNALTNNSSIGEENKPNVAKNSLEFEDKTLESIQPDTVRV